MDYIIAGIRITLPDAFVEGHFARALAPFEIRESGETAAGTGERQADKKPASDTGIGEQWAEVKAESGATSGAETGAACGADAARHGISHSAAPYAQAFSTDQTALIVTAGEIVPEQADYRELSVFDFPDADADCRFGRDGAGYLFVMTPRTSGTPARFRKEYQTPIVVTDLTPEHNSALFRFGIWMMFNVAAVPLHAVAVHSSVIACNGFGVLFLGESGTGKSTHTRLWREHIAGATLLNDDSPIVCIGSRNPAGTVNALHGVSTTDSARNGNTTTETERNGDTGPDPKQSDNAVLDTEQNNGGDSARPQALVSGSPWSGKTPCYKNAILPIRAIVRLSQAPENRIRRLAPIEAIGALLPSCPPAFAHDDTLQDAVCATISAILSQVPTYHLACLPNATAAQLAYVTLFGETAKQPGTVAQADMVERVRGICQPNTAGQASTDAQLKTSGHPGANTQTNTQLGPDAQLKTSDGHDAGTQSSAARSGKAK